MLRNVFFILTASTFMTLNASARTCSDYFRKSHGDVTAPVAQSSNEASSQHSRLQIRQLQGELQNLIYNRRSDLYFYFAESTVQQKEQIVNNLKNSRLAWFHKYFGRIAEAEKQLELAKKADAEAAREKERRRQRDARIATLTSEIKSHQNWALEQIASHPFMPNIRELIGKALPKRVSTGTLELTKIMGTAVKDQNVSVTEWDLERGMAVVKTKVSFYKDHKYVVLNYFEIFDYGRRKTIAQGFEASLQDRFTRTEVYPEFLVEPSVDLNNYMHRIAAGGKFSPEKFNVMAAFLRLLKPQISQTQFKKLIREHVENPSVAAQAEYVLPKLQTIRKKQSQNQRYQRGNSNRGNSGKNHRVNSDESLDFWIWYWLNQPSSDTSLPFETLFKISLLPTELRSEYQSGLLEMENLPHSRAETLKEDLMREIDRHGPAVNEIFQEVTNNLREAFEQSGSSSRAPEIDSSLSRSDSYESSDRSDSRSSDSSSSSGNSDTSSSPDTSSGGDSGGGGGGE